MEWITQFQPQLGLPLGQGNYELTGLQKTGHHTGVETIQCLDEQKGIDFLDPTGSFPIGRP